MTMRRDRLDVLMAERLGELQAEARGAPARNPIIPSGLRALDRIIMGFTPGEVAIFAARPGVGKTVLATRLAVSLGRRGIPTSLFGLEDGPWSFANRAIAVTARVKGQLLRQSAPDAVLEYQRASREVTKMPVHLFNDDEGVTVQALCAEVQKQAVEQGIKVVIVDHWGELLTSLAGFQGKHDAIGHQIRLFRNTCRAVKVAPIVFVQENRKREDSGNRGVAASLSYIADSAEIEKVARIVGLLSTTEYTEEGDTRPDEFNIDVKKNTNGPKGKATLVYNKEFWSCDDPEPLTYDAIVPPRVASKSPFGNHIKNLTILPGGVVE